LLSGRSNVFLLTNEGKNMMIDTAPRYRWPKLQKQLDALHVNHIDYLVLTHAHYDHAENASIIREQYKAKVIIHQEEAANLRNGKFLIPKGTNFATAFIVNFLVNKLALQFSSVPCQCDITVKDKLDLHDFGFNAYILYTPGHTPGSISLIVDNEIALVGDTMFGVFKWSVFPPFADNIPEMINSWGKLLATECRLFIPSHGTANKRALVEKNYKKKKYLVEITNTGTTSGHITGTKENSV